MGTRVYYRDSRGKFHGSVGAAGSSVGRAGGFAVTGSHGTARSAPGKPTGSRGARAVARVSAAQRSQLRAIGRGASHVAKDPRAQRIVVKAAIVGGIGLAAGKAGRRAQPGKTRFAPAQSAIKATVKVVRRIEAAERVAVASGATPRALGMGPKGRATVSARRRRGSKLFSG